MNTIKLKEILAISGKSGLYRYVAQARNGIVVESLEDKKRQVAPASARVSSLDEIAIFTQDEEVPLSDVFYLIHERANGGETLSHKASAAELTAFFEELVPEYDRERVYLSDIKKVFHWYNQLHAHQLLEVVEKEAEQEETAGGETETPGKTGKVAEQRSTVAARKASEKAAEKASEKGAAKSVAKGVGKVAAKGGAGTKTKAK